MRFPLTTAIGAISGYAYYRGTPVSISTVAPYLGAATGLNCFYMIASEPHVPIKPHIALVGSGLIIGSFYGGGWLAGRVIADATKNVSRTNDT